MKCSGCCLFELVGESQQRTLIVRISVDLGRVSLQLKSCYVELLTEVKLITERLRCRGLGLKDQNNRPEAMKDNSYIEGNSWIPGGQAWGRNRSRGCPVSSQMENCSLFMFLLLFEEALFENMQRAFLFELQKANILPAKNCEIFRHLQLFRLSNTEIFWFYFRTSRSSTV